MPENHFDITGESLLTLFKRINEVKNLPRAGWVERGIPNPENVGDHSFGTALIAVLMSEALGMNTGQVAITALIHDLAESVLGDVTPADGMNTNDKSASEEAATREILQGVDPSGQLIELWLDFEHGRTEEGRLVKDVDRLEMALQATVYESEYDRCLQDFFPYVKDRLTLPLSKSIFDQLISIRAKNGSPPENAHLR